MGYLPSRTFCFCIPVRFGMFIMCTLSCTGGSIMAGFGWYSTAHKNETYLTENQGVSVAIASFSYTVLAVISLFGLIGTITKRRSLISLYSTVVWSHLAFNIAAGAYFIYTLFHQVGEDTLSNCIYSYGDDLISLYDCEKEFVVYRNVIICLYVVFCLLELWACLVVSGYIVQLREEEALEYPPPALAAATIPPMTTTYNYRREYAPSLPGKNTIDV